MPGSDKIATFQNRLNEALSIRNMKQVDLAEKTRLNKARISQYMNGVYEAKQDALYLIAKALNVSEAWLMGYDVPMERENFPLPSNLRRVKTIRKVPILGRIACGSPILAEENYEGYIYLPEDVSADFALECKGDSMIDANIFDGDTVFIRMQPEVENGEIAAVLIGEEATLKKVYLDKNTLTLLPANNDYQPMVYVREEMNEVRIIGKLKALLRTFD